MPRVSRHRLEEQQLKELADQFSYLIASLKNERQIEEFLQSFLTPEEKVMLAKRLMLFLMVKKGYGPSVIQRSLNLSYETVRIYADKLGTKGEVFQKILDSLLKREVTKEFLSKVEKFIRPLALLMKARNDMRARATLGSPGEEHPNR